MSHGGQVACEKPGPERELGSRVLPGDAAGAVPYSCDPGLSSTCRLQAAEPMGRELMEGQEGQCWATVSDNIFGWP